VPLLEVYPGLYSLASNKEASIADNFDSVSGSSQWNISFVRSLNDWEMDDLASLYNLLYSYNLGGGVDKIWWVPNRKGKFEVKSFYFILNSSVSFPFPWKSIWRTKAPPRVAFFVWSATFGKILTLDNLRKRNIVLVNRCGMCKKKKEESIDHLLLHCESAQFLWNAFFSCFGLAWVMPRGVVDLLHCWWSGGVRVVLWFGKWYRFVSCGAYGPKGMRDFSRTPKEAWKIFYISFLILFSLGRLLGWSLL
jgi:hypothetical protein